MRKLEELLKAISTETAAVQECSQGVVEKKEACSKLEAQKLQYEAKDETLNSRKDELRKASKDFAKARDLQEKARVDKEQRLLSAKIAANNDKLEECEESLEETKRSIVQAEEKLQSSKQALSQLQKKCNAERVAQYSI